MAISKYPLRALILGALLSILVALYSAYAGLKIGGVYWPMVTTAVVCMALVKFLGGKDKNETNVMQTAASTGGLLAAGVIFTIPALYLMGAAIEPTDIVLVSLTGGLLALIFVYPLRQRMVVEEKLPYADGAAAAAIIKAGDDKGKSTKTLLGALGFGALFALARDYFLLLPQYVNLESLKVAAAKYFSFGSSISLIPLAGGYLIGPRFTLAWFAGAVATYFIIAPYAVSSGVLADKGAVLAEIAKPLGVGIVIGAAIAYFIVSGIPVFRKMLDYYKKTNMGSKGLLAILAIIAVMTYSFDLSLPLTVLAVIGAFLMAFIGAKITGEMNVDPMEIFALIILLAAKFLFGFTALHLVMLAAVVCIAAGVAGNAMMDFKTGHILGTKPEHQLAAEAVGVVAASLVMGFFIASFAHIGFGTAEFPAPQAVAMAGILQGNSAYLIYGAIIGFVFTVGALKFGLGAVAIAFGIGLYVPIELSVPLFIGGCARYFVNKTNQTEKWRLVAGGLIAGEGLVGATLVLISAAKFFGI